MRHLGWLPASPSITTCSATPVSSAAHVSPRTLTPRGSFPRSQAHTCLPEASLSQQEVDAKWERVAFPKRPRDQVASLRPVPELSSCPLVFLLAEKLERRKAHRSARLFLPRLSRSSFLLVFDGASALLVHRPVKPHFGTWRTIFFGGWGVCG